MEELGTTLNQEEFLDASYRLYQTLNVQERNLILNYKKNNPKSRPQGELGQCTFYPQLNPKSLKIVSDKSRDQAQRERDSEISGEMVEKLFKHHR